MIQSSEKPSGKLALLVYALGGLSLALYDAERQCVDTTIQRCITVASTLIENTLQQLDDLRACILLAYYHELCSHPEHSVPLVIKAAKALQTWYWPSEVFKGELLLVIQWICWMNEVYGLFHYCFLC